MWINSEIVRTAESGCRVEQLAALISQFLPEMNLVNLTTAMHRLAKSASSDVQAQRRLKELSIFQELCDKISDILSNAYGGQINPQALSNVAWALATVQHMDTYLVTLIIEHALAGSEICNFKAFELSNLVWAIAKLGKLEPEQFNRIEVQLFYDAVADHMVKQHSHMSFRCLSLTAWAFATARRPNLKLFDQLAIFMKNKIHEADCQELANSTWAFGTLGFINEGLFLLLAKQAIPKLPDFKPQELAIMLWGFATNGFFHEAFYAGAAAIALAKPLQTQHIANILWAFGRVCPPGPLRSEAMLSLVPLCIRQAYKFKAEELASAALALSKTFEETETERLPTEVAEFLSRVAFLVPLSVTKFSTQSLANTLHAFTLAGTYEDDMLDNLFQALGGEVISRMQTMTTQELVRTLGAFLAAAKHTCTSAAAISAAGTIAAYLEGRIEYMRKTEIQCLWRLCSSVFGSENKNPSRPELREYMQCIAWSTYNSKFGHASELLNSETFSTLSTDVDSSSDGDKESSGHDLDSCDSLTLSMQKAFEIQTQTVVKNTFIHIKGIQRLDDDGEFLEIGTLKRSRSLPCLSVEAQGI